MKIIAKSNNIEKTLALLRKNRNEEGFIMRIKNRQLKYPKNTSSKLKSRRKKFMNKIFLISIN